MGPANENLRVRRVTVGLLACATLSVCLLATHAPLLAQANRTSEHWVGTWATALVARPQTQGQGRGQAQGVAPQAQGQGPAAAQGQPAQGQAPQAASAQPAQGGGGRGPAAPPLNFNNQTLRQIVHTSLGGSRARVVLSNTFGTAPLEIGAAKIALRDKDSSIVAKSDRPLTFSGNATITIPAGAIVVSDPVAMMVPPLSDLAVDIFLPGDTASSPSPLTTHGAAHQTNFVSDTGNHAGETALPVKTTTAAWFFLARVEVTAPETTGAVALLGDSITDGSASTDNTNNRWPDHLARRIMAGSSPVKMGVLNLGIGGNRVLSDGAGQSALARFDRDVLSQPGVTHVIVAEGINDIGRDVGADDVVSGLKQLIERAHARGLKILGGTITPVEGVTGNFANYFAPKNEATRQTVNQWIRTSKAYDGVIDFDAAMRDPGRPTQLKPDWSSMDHIHPNDTGYGAFAAAVNLSLLRPSVVPATR
jgi:lysophospholipase L1-like esterase